MSGQTCMQTDSRIVDDILNSNGWKLSNSRELVFHIIDKNGKKVAFLRSEHETPIHYFISFFDLLYVMTTYLWINGHKNPYVGLTEEEILIKCDLES